jgi:glycosyltransferase involved in cell wall biosynthesis
LVDVILPVLDEASAIPWVVERMPSTIRPIVVDNGSTDRSADVARALGVEVIHEPVRGFGSACFAGLRAATAEIVAFMDCDASLDPRDLLAVVAPVEHGRADLVVGARRPERGAWPIHSRVANGYLARRVSRRFGLQLTDLGPMRASHRTALLELDIRDRRSGWPLEMVLRAAVAGWRIEEVSVPYHARRGRSKVTGTVRGTVRAIRDQRYVLAEISRPSR